MTTMLKEKIESRNYYPFVTKILIELFNNGELPNVAYIDVEPDVGLVGRIVYRNGSVHVLKRGHLGVNSLGASEISSDKLHSKYFLERLGYKTPKGHAIIMPGFFKNLLEKDPLIVKNAVKAEQAHEYVESEIGYPCYAKPNFGSQGRGILRCENRADLEKAVNAFRERGNGMFLLEEAIDMPDYRVVVLRDEVISCYLRKHLSVTGNGSSSIIGLLEHKQEEYEKQGRDTVLDFEDPRIAQVLARKGLTLESVLRKGESCRLLDVSNLSLGGESEDFTERIHEYWKNLCVGVTADMGLKLCGVDLACRDLEDPDSGYSILEINAAPGLDNYASSGKEQERRVIELYRKVFNSLGE
jgi:D-alanine-D-alanine ligase-like ATP-grasp enzyme